MIYDSVYWKDELIKLADKLEMRVIQRRWWDKSYYTLEKEIFFGFYSIRKLIESQKISKTVVDKTFNVLEFKSNEQPESIIRDLNLSAYDFNKAKKTNMSILKLCNQFIHSYYFSPLIVNRSLIGFFICSDYKRKSGIYFITLFEVVDIYRVIGENYPKSYSAVRGDNGKITTHIE